MGRFHAWFNREITEALPEGETEWGSVGKQTENKDGADNSVFADIKGKGHFVGLKYYVQCPTPMWYGCLLYTSSGDFTIFGGIYRNVWLISAAKQHISLTDYASTGLSLIHISARIALLS